MNALIKRGTAHQHQGDNKSREEDFKKAIEVDENNPDIYHHLGQVIILVLLIIVLLHLVMILIINFVDIFRFI